MTSAARRKDPSPALTSLEFDQSEVEGKDPNRVYQWVDPLRGGGPQLYEDTGWRLERHGESAPKPKHSRAKLKVGDPIRGVEGMVLMSIERAAFEEMDRDGHRGGGGQKEADRITNLMLLKGRGGGLDNPDRGGPIHVIANEETWPTGA